MDELKSSVNPGDMQVLIYPNPARDHIAGRIKSETKPPITDMLAATCDTVASSPAA